MSRLRRRKIIPDDTVIHAVLEDPKLVHGKFGRQVEAKVRVLDGDYKGTMFKTWLSFAKDKDTGEEYIPYGGPLYQALSLVNDDVEVILDDDDLSESDYEKFLKKSVKALDEFEISARVGVKAPKDKPEKKSNFLQPDTFGPYVDPDEALAEMTEDLEV
jgi:hypothetical protein